jgi:unsaturated rhamnogalacturonyl hydrolase
VFGLGFYFPKEESVYQRFADSTATILGTIASKYIGDNPPTGFTFRTVYTEGIKQLEDGRYDLDLGSRFPDSPLGHYAYAYAALYCERDETVELALSCYGPSHLYLNGQSWYKSTMADDVDRRRIRLLRAELRQGWNDLFIKVSKTSSGFGCIIGSSNSKWFPLHFLSPLRERAGSGGWIYSEPTDQDWYEKKALPAWDSLEAESGLHWLPPLQPKKPGVHPTADLQSLFGRKEGQIAYGWTSFQVEDSGSSLCHLTGTATGQLRIWIGNDLVATTDNSRIDLTCSLKYGRHQLLVESADTSAAEPWEYDLNIELNGETVPWICPQNIQGPVGSWLHLGPFTERLHDPLEIRTLYRLFNNGSEEVYWRTGTPHLAVRPYLENRLYARWNYPLGVTLYGLLQTGRMLDRQDITDYAAGHIDECTNLYAYSLWDRQVYGSAAINHQLVELDMLDDCGSFGSAMLEAYKDHRNPDYVAIADIIADYMKNTQERQSNGAFYRQRSGEYQERTLWADDLYMSTPFLTRYYELTGETEYLDDAALQFLLFKEYLYMPELQMMSHVYDFKYNVATYVPWGRGNGWVLFSLSELLAVMPEHHEKRAELLAFFGLLAEGYVRLQDEDGLWHQILTDASSYPETSSTAMFAYAFSRGLRHGWLTAEGPYINAVYKAWDGLTRHCIDQWGNVHGVCQGSGYSFTPDYYRNELHPILNDTHGIGIILLCGIEVMALTRHLQQDPSTANSVRT